MENNTINGSGDGTGIASSNSGTSSTQGEQQVMASIFSNLLTRLMNTANENANNG